MKYLYNKETPSRPHAVLFEPANQEKLLEMSKAAILRKEVVDWLNENIGNRYWEVTPYFGMLNFTTEEDALAFILRWS